MRPLLGILLLVLASRAAAKPITCEDTATGDEIQVKIPRVKRALRAVRKTMKQRGIHVLDLPQDAQDRRRRLDEDLAAKEWCVVRSHVVAFEDAVEMTKVDEAFVSAKFSRVEKWARAIDAGKRTADVGKAIANATAFIADGRHDRANQALNKALYILFGDRDPWAMPPPEILEGPAEEGAPRRKTEIRSSDVAKGCPMLAKKGRASKDDMQTAVRKLGKLMDRRLIRPIDFEGGDDLVADMKSYAELGAFWPATRVACAMLAFAEEAEVDLGLVQKRFLHITRLRDERGVKPEIEEQFKTLVRTASDYMANQEWGPAHLALEELLVLMGEPSKPSDTLP